MIVSESQQMEAKERILIIDDDEDIRNSLALFLKKQDYGVEVAKDGQDGLEKIAEKFHNLVLLDIKLPDINGIELIIPIKEKQPDIEIIMITGNADINSAINSLHKGASGYINKPLNLDELLASIRHSIEKQHLIAEKQQTEQKLKESEEKYRNMINNLDIGFFKVSFDGIYLDHNPAHNRILGIDPFKNLTGSKSIYFWQNPKDRQNYLKELTKNGFIKDFVVYVKKKSDEQIILQANAHLIKNSNGEMIAIEGTFTDITERYYMEEKLRMNEELFRDFFDSAAIGFHIFKSDRIITDMNKYELDLLGYSREEIVDKKTWYDLIIPEQKLQFEKHWNDILDNGSVNNLEYTLIHKDGHFIDVLLNASSRFDDKDNLINTRGSVLNITDRKKAEEINLKLAAIVENSDDAITGKTLDGTIISWNKGAERIYSYTSKEIIGKPISILVPSDRPDEVSGILERIKAGDLIDHFETVRVRKDGEEINISLTISPIKDKDDIIIGTSTIARNITERKVVELELKKSEHNLRERVKELTCLYELSKLVESLDYSLKEILQGTLDLIPPAWQFPEITCARISFYGQEFKTKNFKETTWKQKADIKRINEIIGTIEVYYLKNMPIFDEGPFLKEERNLINACAEILGRYFERNEAEEKINNLAKFPSENPNPVLRINRNGIIYANKVSQDLFKIEEGDKTPMLLKDMVDKVMKTKITKTAEIELAGQIYSLVINPIRETNYVNVYGMDITVRKMAEQAIQKRTKEISMLLDASRAVLQYNDFEIVASLIFNSCMTLIGAEAGYIGILTPDKKQNQIIFSNPGKLQCEVDLDLPVPIRGIHGEVIKSKKTLYQNNFSNSDWINFLPEGHIPVNNVLFAPLIINDEVKGLMGLVNREGGFTEEEARLATAFAELASISLLNCQMLESLEKSERKYKRLSNILEQKVEERTIELKESEEKIQNMITNISEVLLEAEPSGILTYISPQINNIIGYQSEQLIGLNFMELIHLEDVNSFKETAAKALETKKVVSIECRLKHKKGYFVPVSARWSLVEINNEFKVIGLMSDNTERKEIDNMIKREIKQLKELDQIRNDLIQRISHELNTPLISILNGSQFLLDSYNDQMSNVVGDIVKIIYQGGYRLKEMVDNLTTAYELETEQIIFNIKRENLIPIVKECVEELIFQAEKRKVFINIELPPDLNIDVDKRMIKKVILNLLSNAVKNTLPNGNIFIKSIKHHNFMDIIIKDTGVGLTKKEMLTLFKKFGKIERYGKGMDVDIEGPGLGLYIANEIVKLHVGEILVKSKGRNEGSTFILRLFIK